ncbi:hypothetical protein [Acetanaerobacterium elongatum]|uniref:Uncharacterized protein n=1 Tax=Acetanaerobacterium elongatum TaxID=258515 RepID=A0A1H0DZN7_9FIRM|nr:hypothetical protein [Acetanaerobacterium elongatum]SDN75654.1 hypothetical protein SAMN05192585_13113 [Acetanaerobacterium elongatum]
MSTSAIKGQHNSRHFRKTMLVYLAISVFCIVFDRIYALFGHGVYSASMSLMFLYPLLGGALPFLLLWQFAPQEDSVSHYRLYYNCYNSGIAALTVQSLLNGIFEIAGTASRYLIVFVVCGWVMVAAGLVLYLMGLYRYYSGSKLKS